MEKPKLSYSFSSIFLLSDELIERALTGHFKVSTWQGLNSAKTWDSFL